MAEYWEFPGGKLEKNETLKQCLVRELKEELGIETKIGAYLGESVFDYGEKIIRLVAYTAVHVGGEFRLRDHDDFRWLSVNELRDVQWAPADIPLLEPVKALLIE